VGRRRSTELVLEFLESFDSFAHSVDIDAVSVYDCVDDSSDA
jgi:hypothetical protein